MQYYKISFFCTICSLALSHSSSVHPFCIFLRYFHFFQQKHDCCFSLIKDENWFATLTWVSILNTKLLAGNEHVIDIFTGKHIKNISLCSYRILLSTIITVIPSVFGNWLVFASANLFHVLSGKTVSCTSLILYTPIS